MNYSEKEKENHNNYRLDESQMKESDNKFKSGSFNSKNSASMGMSLSKKLPRLDAHEYEKKIQDLLEKIEILESRLKTTSDQKLKILQRLKDYEEDNDRMKDQIARQASHNQRLSEEVTVLNNRIQELTNSNRNVNEKCKTKFEILNKELEEKDNQLEKLVSQIKAKDETIKYFSVNNEQTIRNQNVYKEELENLKSINTGLEDKIRSLEKTIDELYVNKKSEAALQLEIEHLKDDNVRLLQMLKTTEEYKDFAYLAENVSGGIKFIKNNEDCKSNRRCKSGCRPAIVNKNKNNCFVKECEKKKFEKEDPFNGDNWVPADAYNCAYEFRNKYNVEMSESLINDLLSALNKIWREREKKQISRIKTKYQSEIMGLRRKANMSTTFDEFTASKTISKLKKDLKNAKDDLRSQIVEKNKLKNTPNGIDLVDNALKIAANFQKTKRHLESEINNLKKRLEERDDKTASENFERLKFNEGSFWMIGRVLKEIESLEKCLDELYYEFEDRVKNVFALTNSSDLLDFNSKILTNSKKWFYQSMKEILENLKSKFENWHYDIEKSFDALKYTY